MAQPQASFAPLCLIAPMSARAFSSCFCFCFCSSSAIGICQPESHRTHRKWQELPVWDVSAWVLCVCMHSSSIAAYNHVHVSRKVLLPHQSLLRVSKGNETWIFHHNIFVLSKVAWLLQRIRCMETLTAVKEAFGLAPFDQFRKGEQWLNTIQP